MLWNGNECGKNQGNENIRAKMTNTDRSKICTISGICLVVTSSLFWDVTHRRLWLVTEVSGQPTGPVFRGQAVQKSLTLEDGTDRLSRNVSKCTNLRFVTAKKSEHRRTRTLENVNCFDYLCSVITNDERCTHEIKTRIAMAKAAFNRKKIHFNSKLEFILRKKLVRRYMWSLALCGAET